jgi:hypothetical protein
MPEFKMILHIIWLNGLHFSGKCLYKRCKCVHNYKMTPPFSDDELIKKNVILHSDKCGSVTSLSIFSLSSAYFFHYMR